jgi:translation initiation factor 2-alpha kinase 4
MFELGVVLAQMVFGNDVHLKYSSPADLVRNLPRNSPPVLKRVLSDLLLLDGKKRPGAARLAAQLAETSGSSTSKTPSILLSTTPPNPLQGWHQLASGQRVATPLVSPPPTQLSRSVEAPSGFFYQPKTTASRYRSEFEELEFLGKGGGGQVVKARNRLDGHLYAIKKIRLPSDRASEVKLLREVTIWYALPPLPGLHFYPDTDFSMHAGPA